jgi:hypothetical protein
VQEKAQMLRLRLTDKAWSPYVAGAIIGLQHVPKLRRKPMTTLRGLAVATTMLGAAAL